MTECLDNYLLTAQKGPTMAWIVDENNTLLITDAGTGARIEQRKQGSGMDAWGFDFILCEPPRYIQLFNEFKSKYLSKIKGTHWLSPESFDPCLQLDADWLNWRCSDKEANLLSTIYPQIVDANQYERNSLLVKYAIMGLIAKNKKWSFGNKPYSFFYSDFEQKKSLGKNYNYYPPSDDELITLMK